MTLHLQMPAREAEPHNTVKRGAVRILLVDANAADAIDLCSKLSDAKQAAFSLYSVTTLGEGLLALSKQRFDVILVDSHSAESGGAAMLAKLRFVAPETPVVALTSIQSESEAIEMMRAGAQDYLVKSRLNTAALERIILYCMERQRATHRRATQYEVSRVLAEAESVHTAATGLLELLAKFANCQRAHLWLLDHWTGDLALTETWMKTGAYTWNAEEPTRFALGEELPGTAWANGAPEYISDLSQHRERPRLAAAASAGFASALAFPVKLGGDTLGVIEFFGRGAIDGDDDFLRLLMNAGGQLGQFVARKTAEDEKDHLTRERLLILDCAAEGIFGVDLHGSITFMNRSAAAALQCMPGNVLGRNSHDLFCPPSREKSSHSAENCPIALTIARGEGLRGQHGQMRRTNNTRFESDFAVFPLVEAGEMKGAVVCFNDVTERKRMELELRHAQKLEAVGALAAGIAHEINTPIQFVGDNARFLQDAFKDVAALVKHYEDFYELAKRGAVDQQAIDLIAAACDKADWQYLRDEVPKALDQALDGVGRVATIVRGMKEFSHVARTAEKTPADLNKAIESTLIVARNELKYVADVETQFGELPPVPCHLGDLNQVFLNLLINAAHAIADAVKGTANKGRIIVRTRRDSDWIEVAISDTGTGIPEAVRDKIFDPFFTTKEVGKGTGQGLALARAIVVEKHNGTLTFETEMGKGTTFRIRLPLDAASES